MHELPLVFFTILGQMGAGAVFISALYYLVNKQPQRVLIIERINITAIIFMAIAMGIASFHLGQPLRAMNVIFGVGRSPMSNEIFTFSLLFGIVFATALLAYFSKPKNGNKLAFIKKLANRVNAIPHIHALLAIITILVSVVFIWMIVATYMLPTVNNWNTGYTALQIYTSMLILGGLLAITFDIRKIGFIFFFIGALIVLVTKIPYINFIDQHSPQLAIAQYCWWQIQCGLLVLAMLITLINSRKQRHSTAIYAISLLLAIVAELCGRIAFYNLWAISM